MNITIRVDASSLMGSGHVMRCIALGDTFAENGSEVSFICRELEGHLCDFMENRGLKVYRLPPPKKTLSKEIGSIRHKDWLGVPLEEDCMQTEEILRTIPTPDWLILDHYALDVKWENFVRRYVRKILVIDDLADRAHDCDILLDQNVSESHANIYQQLTPKNCEIILGPRYSLLRSEFRKKRSTMRQRDGKIKRILISFGMIDQTNETFKTLKVIESLQEKNFSCDVVVGQQNWHKNEIENFCKQLPHTRFHFQVDYLSELIAAADLAIGASGSTHWERCCLGLPSLLISVAFNQESIGKTSQENGTGIYLGTSEEVTSERIANEIKNLFTDSKRMLDLSRNAKAIVDGEGALRVYDRMLKKITTKL